MTTVTLIKVEPMLKGSNVSEPEPPWRSYFRSQAVPFMEIFKSTDLRSAGNPETSSFTFPVFDKLSPLELPSGLIP